MAAKPQNIAHGDASRRGGSQHRRALPGTGGSATPAEEPNHIIEPPKPTA